MTSDAATELLASPEFIEQLKTGDRAALSRLARASSGLILDYLKRTKGRHGLQEADWLDVLQETFAKFITHPPDLDPRRSMLPYLRTMALNEAKDMAKKRSRQRHRETQALAGEVRLAAGAESSTPMIRNEELTAAKRTLGRLSQSDQQAVGASMTGDSSPGATLAARNGITLEAAQMRITRALVRLRHTDIPQTPRGDRP